MLCFCVEAELFFLWQGKVPLKNKWVEYNATIN